MATGTTRAISGTPLRASVTSSGEASSGRSPTIAETTASAFSSPSVTSRGTVLSSSH